MGDSSDEPGRQSVLGALEEVVAAYRDHRAEAIRAGSPFLPPDLRHPTHWVKIQRDVVDLAERSPADRERLAKLLFELVGAQRASAEDSMHSATFELFRTTLDAHLLLTAVREPGRQSNDRIVRFLWSDEGELGDAALRELLSADPRRATGLMGDMCQGRRASWSDEVWIGRLELLAGLEAELSVAVRALLHTCRVPTAAVRAFTAAVVAHAPDTLDFSDLGLCTQVRDAFASVPDDVQSMVDWEGGMRRPVQFRQMLDLWCEPGQRTHVTDAALRAGLISDPVARFLAQPLPRPFWADGRDGLVAQLASHEHQLAGELARLVGVLRVGYGYSTPPAPGVVRAALAADGLVDPPAELLVFFQAQGGGIELLDGGAYGLDMARKLRAMRSESAIELERIAWPIRSGGGWSWLGAVPEDEERCSVWRFELEVPRVCVADSITEFVVAAREVIEAAPQTAEEVLALPHGDVLGRHFNLGEPSAGGDGD